MPVRKENEQRNGEAFLLRVDDMAEAIVTGVMRAIKAQQGYPPPPGHAGGCVRIRVWIGAEGKTMVEQAAAEGQ